jgi:hypothetical protein
MGIKDSGLSLKERLLKKKKIKKSCWEWQGFIMPNGYGRMSFKGKDQYVHRLSFAAFIGEIPKGKIICHSCDNRKCINPKHLWIGTFKENTQDACTKGKMKGFSRKVHSEESKNKMRKPHNINRKGEKHPNAILDENKVKEIRNLFSQGLTRKEISEIFKITKNCVKDVVLRRSWKHI